MGKPQIRPDDFSDFNDIARRVAALERTQKQDLNTALQPGVDGAGDLLQNGSGINAATGQVFLVLVAGAAWVKNTSGLLVRIPYSTPFTQINLPATISSGQFIGLGIDINQDGSISITNRPGTAQASSAACLTQLNTRPAITASPGYLPICDLVVGLSGTTYSFAAFRDRRTFSKGFRKTIIWTPATAPSTTLGTMVAIDASATNPSPGSFSLRAECSGNSAFYSYWNACRWQMPASGIFWGFMLDGNNQINAGLYNGGADHDRPLTVMTPMVPGIAGGLTAGSRLFQPAWQSGTAGQVSTFSGPFGIFWEIHEQFGGETSNGTS